MVLRWATLPLLFLMICGCAFTKSQSYPVADLAIHKADLQDDGSLQIRFHWFGASVPAGHKIDEQDDQIVVSWTKASTKYAVNSGNLTIDNPKGLPVYVADGIAKRQIYPVNELAYQSEPD